MKLPSISHEFHVTYVDEQAEDTPLGLACEEFAEDAALADRVGILEVRQKYASEDSDLDPLSPEEQAEYFAGERALRKSLMRRLRSGELVARGIPEGRIHYEPIQPATWLNVIVDWQESTIDVHGVEVRGVRIGPAPETMKDAPGKPWSAPASRGRGRSFKNADAALVDEAAEAVMRGKASGPMDGARLVADRATGKGSPTSKVKRLAPQIQSLLNERGWQPR